MEPESPASPALQVDSLLLSHQGSPNTIVTGALIKKKKMVSEKSLIKSDYISHMKLRGKIFFLLEYSCFTMFCFSCTAKWISHTHTYNTLFLGFPFQRVKHLLPTWETWVRSLGREDPLEKEMVTQSSILAWRIPWMEKPGGLQSMGSQRVWHDWATSLHLRSP